MTRNNPEITHILMPARRDAWRRLTRRDLVAWRRVAPALGALALWLVLACALALALPPWSVGVDVGAEGPFVAEGQAGGFRNFFGVQRAEQAIDGSGRSFRWTSERMAITFPSAQRMRPVLIELTACACRPDAAAVAMELVVNNRPLAAPLATNQWRRYQVVVPARLPHPDGSVMLEVAAPLWQASDRAVGVAVDRIGLRQLAPAALADPLGAAVAALGVGLLMWRRRLLAAVALVAAYLALGAAYLPQLLARDTLALLLVGGVLLLVWQSPARRWAEVWAVGLSLWLVLSGQLLGRWVVDDAYISLRYARQLVDGNGLVFNAGERVEGYTNFLWTLLLAGVMAIGGDPVGVVSALTPALAFVTLALTLALGRRLVAPGWAWVAPTLLAVSGPFLLYTARGSGMETALFGGLLLATLLGLLAERWRLAGLLTALTLMTRPDGVLLAVAGGVYAMWRGWRTGAGLRPVVGYAAVAAAIFGPYFAWRWGYYGYLLPNTFYVKVGGSGPQLARGLAYAGTFARDDLLLPLAALACAMGVWRARSLSALPREPLLIGGCAALYAVYIVAVGGDWMPGARFWVPVLPLLALLIAWGAGGGVERRGPSADQLGAAAGVLPQGSALRVARGALCAACVALLAIGLPATSGYNPESPVWHENEIVERSREVGRWIAANTPPDTVVAVAAAGALPYYAGRPAIDVLGLNDTYIAHLPPTLDTGKAGHEKTDAEYVLGRRPAIIPWFAAPYLIEHPAFAANYRRIERYGPEGYAIALYVRRDLIDRLPRQ